MPKMKPISIKKNKLPYIYINSHVFSILTIIFFSIILSVIGLMLGDVMSLDTIKRFIDQPEVFILNTLPLTLLMLCIYFATSQISYSYLLGGGFFIVVELINRFKIALRDDPLIPADIILGGEVANVIKLSELPVSKYLVAMLVLFVAAALFLILFIRSAKLKLIGRISGMLICLLIFTVTFNTVYKDVKYFDQLPVVGTIYNSTDVFQSRGFVYSFLVSFESLKVKKPDGYSRNKAEQLLKKYEVVDPKSLQKRPNVIAIMGEAFYDFDRIPGVKFVDGKNPLKNFNQIKKESYYGSMVTSVFGGGTSSTELNFLTGYHTSLLPNGLTPYKTHIRNNTYSLARFFEDNGYATMAFHPGFSWFYNRQNVYNYFGFDDIIFRKDTDMAESESEIDLRRGYVKDSHVMDYIMDYFDRDYAEKSGKPLFSFAVTIENHGPYNNEVYNEKILKKPAGMTDDVYNVINTYLYGLREADIALGKLVSELKKRDEPFVLVYFGDHLPFLNKNYEGYSALNYNIGQGKDLKAFLNNYQTPFLIWSNDAARELLKSNNVKVPSGKAPEISSSFLSAELIKYLGLPPCPFYEFLIRFEKKLPVISHKYFKQDGKYVTQISPQNQKLLVEYRQLQYYMMFDDNNYK